MNAAARELVSCATTSVPPASAQCTRDIGPRNATEVTVAAPAGSASTVTASGRTIAQPCPDGMDPVSVRSDSPKIRAHPSYTSQGIVLFSPTKSATNGVAGCEYNSAGAAICSSRPRFITPTRSAIASASS